MNILIDDIACPDQAEVNGSRYEIRTNFRTSILFELMMQDDSLDAGDSKTRATHDE